MNKLLLIAFLTLFCSFGAKASHLMGGDITLYNDSPNNYTIKVQLYRDVNGIALAPTVSLDVFTYSSSLTTYVYDSTITLNQNAALSLALVPFFPYGVEVGIFTMPITLPAGDYKFVYSVCCRNVAILNATNAGSENMTLYTDLAVPASVANSTPECATMPVAYFPQYFPGNYNPLPYDADGDSLTWSLNTPIGMYSLATLQMNPIAGFTPPPSVSSGPFSMNAYTGEITWTPSSMGNFVQSFQINEFRNGVQIGTIIRDMQYVIVPDSSADTLTILPDSLCSFDTTHQCLYRYYHPGQAFSFKVDGSTTNTATTLGLNAFGSIFKLTTNPATFTVFGSGNVLTGNLQWTPATNFSKDVIVVFRASGGRFVRDLTVVLKKDPNITNEVATLPTAAITVNAYPNPANHQLNVDMDITEDMQANISLVSVLGERVETIFNGKLNKGTKHLSHPLQIPAGIYYMLVNNNGHIISRQTICIQ